MRNGVVGAIQHLADTSPAVFWGAVTVLTVLVTIVVFGLVRGVLVIYRDSNGGWYLRFEGEGSSSSGDPPHPPLDND